MIAYFFIFILSCLVVVAGIKIEDLKQELKTSKAFQEFGKKVLGETRWDLKLTCQDNDMLKEDLEKLELEYLLLADKYHRGE
jgi:hypothetical protein